MTREEILEGLYEIKNWKCNGDAKLHKVVIEAIKALEQEPCDNAISRQEVLDRIRESIETYHNQYTTDMLNMWGLFTQFIKEMPPVNPQPKAGHWIKIKPYPLQMHDYECSECLHETDDPTENYCSECGAKMVEPQESEG